MITRIARAIWHIFNPHMAEAGGGAQTVEPAQAREFVAGFVHDPQVLAGMKDDQVMAYHGQVTKALDGHVAKARESYDWRKDVAGDNADALKTLERFASPKALYESYDQFRTRLSKGDLKAVTPYPEKGTAEQQATWRTENGIPADGKYEFKMPDGVKITEADKPILESFAKYAHTKNMPATAVNEAAAWYFQERAAREEAAKTEFDTAKRDTAATLGAEWGADYKPNLNAIQGMIDATVPADQADLKTLINNALATNVHFARHYAALALQINPGGTMVTGDRGAQEGSVVDELKKIETGMKTNRAAYDKDEVGQKRYRDLIDAYGRLTGKDWGKQAVAA